MLQKFIEEFLNSFINFETVIHSSKIIKMHLFQDMLKVERILLQLKSILHNNGIKEIRSEIGEKFNLEIHEALLIKDKKK